MEETIKMIKWLKGTSQVELNINANTVIDRNMAQGKKNVYFVAGLGSKSSKRCEDEDITTKKYFVVDIDIRLDNFKKTGKVMDGSEMENEIGYILEKINNSEYGGYCAVVNSGNGMHLYYSGEERPFQKDTYSNGVSMIYEGINETIKERGYKCDPVCTNLARIMRLPGTINPRKKMKGKEVLRDLGDMKCYIIEFTEKDSELFGKIEEYAEEYKKQRDQEKQEQVKIKEIVKRDYVKSDDIWRQINDIPAVDIACNIRGVSVSDRGLDNVALKEQHKNMGAYRYKPHNVIVNTGSSMIKTDKSYFTSYELVYYELMGQDKKATIEYFRDKYGIKTDEKQEKKTIVIPKLEYEKQGYLYGNSTFDDFDCMMSGELVTIVARSNSGKTTFAMDIIQTNARRGKKCYYINLEFPIETMRRSRRLYLNGKKKRNLTDIEPLTEEDKYTMNEYVQTKLKQFDYHNAPDGMNIADITEMIIKKQKEGYGLIVIDTFSRITGNLDSAIAHTSQNKTMEVLQELCQNIGIVIVLLHHTNKKGEFEGSQKIMDLSNVFITMTADEDAHFNKITKFALSKDKFVSSMELETYYEKQEYSLVCPKPIKKAETDGIF